MHNELHPSPEIVFPSSQKLSITLPSPHSSTQTLLASNAYPVLHLHTLLIGSKTSFRYGSQSIQTADPLTMLPRVHPVMKLSHKLPTIDFGGSQMQFPESRRKPGRHTVHY